MEAVFVARLGGELVGCFKSEKTIWLGGGWFGASGMGALATVPSEFAFASYLRDPYTSSDLDKLLAKDIEQWKGFESLNKEAENYTARLNELIKSAGRFWFFKLGSSFKPVLVSIGRISATSFSVVAIRSYVLDSTGTGYWINAQNLPFVTGQSCIRRRVDASAFVLRESRLVRLIIRRVLTDPSDVDQVQSEIVEWANAVSSTLPDQGGDK
jgi:hypothetical protein